MSLSSWMHGVRARQEGAVACDAYRGASGGRLTVEVRNPPVLSMLVCALGIGVLALHGALMLWAEPLQHPFSAFQLLATVVGGLILTTRAIAALRFDVRFEVENDRLVVTRGARSVRCSLVDAERVVADESSGNVVLVASAEPRLVAEHLLPEQAAMVAAALDGALRTRGAR